MCMNFLKLYVSVPSETGSRCACVQNSHTYNKCAGLHSKVSNLSYKAKITKTKVQNGWGPSKVMGPCWPLMQNVLHFCSVSPRSRWKLQHVSVCFQIFERSGHFRFLSPPRPTIPMDTDGRKSTGRNPISLSCVFPIQRSRLGLWHWSFLRTFPDWLESSHRKSPLTLTESAFGWVVCGDCSSSTKSQFEKLMDRLILSLIGGEIM